MDMFRVQTSEYDHPKTTQGIVEVDSTLEPKSAKQHTYKTPNFGQYTGLQTVRHGLRLGEFNSPKWSLWIKWH